MEATAVSGCNLLRSVSWSTTEVLVTNGKRVAKVPLAPLIILIPLSIVKPLSIGSLLAGKLT